MPLADFKKWTIKKQLTTRNESVVANLTAAQATVVRDSVAKFIYSCLFDVSNICGQAKPKWLVCVINESLAGDGASHTSTKFIGVLDIVSPMSLLDLIAVWI